MKFILEQKERLLETTQLVASAFTSANLLCCENLEPSHNSNFGYYV